jgi:hypothetical protein
METGILSFVASAVVAKAALDAWFYAEPFGRAHERRTAAHAADVRGGFLRGLR